MQPGGVRLTRRGWVVLAVVGLLVVTGLTITLTSRSGPPDCTVRDGDRVVELDRDDVQAAATATTPVVRRGTSAPTEAVRRAASLSSADAGALSAALTGQARAALTCDHGGATSSESDALDTRGLTGRAAVVREDIQSGFGPMSLGGFAPGGVSTGHMAGSAHYEGRAIDVFFRPVNARSKTRGWALAHYLVAHADRLEVDTVIFDDRIWTARRAEEGWRDYRVDTAGKSRAVARVLEHRDHVHVDVAD
jgi:hypothetical protein